MLPKQVVILGECHHTTPAKKRDILKVIASLEKREMKEILSDLIDEYIEIHKETLDLPSKPEWAEAIEQGA